MKNLPIYEVIQEIQSSLKSHSKLILQAPPGAGKSTVVPLELLNEPWLKNKMIIMLEPRRVAARMVATRMAKSLGEEVGEIVGYQVKMDGKYSSKTKILIVTEALLIRKLQYNPDLADIGLIIFDEFHERSVHTDLSLALSLQVQELLRDDLKILIMSATLNSNELVSLLENTPVVTSLGKSYDIEVSYLEAHTAQPNHRTLNALLVETTLKALRDDVGDILLFLAGVKEIKALQKGLQDRLKQKNVLITPLYSALSKVEQDMALNHASKRKIIIATNIAQTSLTIEGVKVVIDSGFEKLSRYNYANGMNHLELSFISKDSAIQRAGRAGRLCDGKCYRLWHENKILQQQTKPEILRSDLSSVVLDLAQWGVEDFSELIWLDAPDEKVVNSAKEVLQELNMLDKDFKITTFGKNSLLFGLHPRFSYMILKANELGFAYEASLLASLLSERDVFSSFNDSDIVTRFTNLHDIKAKDIKIQAKNIYKRVKKVHRTKAKFSNEMIAVLLLFAYPDRLAKQRGKNDARYKLSNSKGAVLNQEDSLFNEEYLVVASLNAHEKNSYINLSASISYELIDEYFGSYITNKKSMNYNKEKEKLEFRDEKYFLKLKLDSTPTEKVDKKYLKKLFIELVKEEGLEFLEWSKKAVSLKQRVCFINTHCKNEIQDFSDEYLLSSLHLWLEPFLESVSTIKELKMLDMFSILSSLLSWEHQKLLDKLAPKQIKVPSGSSVHVDYSNPQIPSLHVRIQELFGLNETPKVLDNTFALQIHLLSPAKRAIQITYDLASFWKNSYDEVRKELRGKYKKHYWPENPYDAVATKKIKKYM